MSDALPSGAGAETPAPTLLDVVAFFRDAIDEDYRIAEKAGEAFGAMYGPRSVAVCRAALDELATRLRAASEAHHG